MSGQYQRAMTAAKRRRFFRALPEYLLGWACLIILVYLASFESVRYWTWEVGASLAIDALVYVVLPFMAIGIVCAILKHWRIVVHEIFGIFREVVAMIVP